MQQIDSFFETAMKRGYVLEGTPRVIAEWNFNNLVEVDIQLDPDAEPWIYEKYFPLESIAEGLRPRRSSIFHAFTDDAETSGGSVIADSRFYLANEQNVYKYWISPELSEEDPISFEDDEESEHYPIAFASATIDYGMFIRSNKLSATFNLGAVPADWSLYVFEEDFDDWIEINNPEIDLTNGTCDIWWDGELWVQEQQLAENISQNISKVRIEVRALNRPASRLQLVEFSARREIEISSRVESFNLNSSMDDEDLIHPIGRVSSNDGSITFDNSDLAMNHDDPTSDFYGSLRGWCEYRIYIQYDLTRYSGSPTTLHRLATMVANDWKQTNEDKFEVEIFDNLKILQTIDCPAFLMEDKTIAEVVSTILDNVGVDNYSFSFSSFDSTNVVKYFWTDGTESVFDVLDKLCASYQCALFVDEFGAIRLLSREDVSGQEGIDPVWTFLGEKDGQDIPDIEKLDRQYNLQANRVKIKYTRREAKVDAGDITEQPLTSEVWSADDTVVLRATPLVRALVEPDNPASGANHDIWVTGEQARLWPYSGKVNINGEFIEYESKGYRWHEFNPDGTATVNIAYLTSDEEKRVLDRKTYHSYLNIDNVEAAGIGTKASQFNRFNGRLRVKERDIENTGIRGQHEIKQTFGWHTLNFWSRASRSTVMPNRYFTTGNSSYNLANLMDWENQPGWLATQRRATVKNSILNVNNDGHPNDDPQHATMVLRDLGDTEFREIGTRLRIKKTHAGKAMILLYVSNASGYDNTGPQLTEPHFGTRCYVINITATEVCDRINRSINEVYVQVKNGDSLSPCTPSGKRSTAGATMIGWNKWYDIDIVFRDGVGEIPETSEQRGTSAIEIFVDGAYNSTWFTEDNIRPTSIIGLGAKYKSNIDYEYVYGTTTTTKGRLRYKNDDLFDAFTLQLPAGVNQETVFGVPANKTFSNGEGVLSLGTAFADATISRLEIIGARGTENKPIVGSNAMILRKDSRFIHPMKDLVDAYGRFRIRYTSTYPISVCYEYARVSNYPYGIDNEPTPPPTSFYDPIKRGYVSMIKDDSLFTPQRYWSDQLPEFDIETQRYIGYFFDDFGSFVREVRDFDVEYDNLPAKSVSIYNSNERVQVLHTDFHPTRGRFTLINTSNRNEIINGTEEIDAENSIDHSLLLYGFMLEDLGDEEEEVKNTLSIRRHGTIPLDIDAEWIFTKEEAKSLGEWITQNWSEPMDTLRLETFCSSFLQIGDKVTILYSNTNIDPDWVYAVTEKEISFDQNGLVTRITVRRVR